ncbi:unnamed protein product [Rangifer tarandus platyrhynchus]|uniref:Uncharacterized protein n=1 Tax=Rangifer tarandus platyrhynchus TaxID=3082113 RepID=A0AC59YAD0_RANTA
MGPSSRDLEDDKQSAGNEGVMPAIIAESLLLKTEDQQPSITWELVETQPLGPHPRPETVFSQDLQVIHVHDTF